MRIPAENSGKLTATYIDEPTQGIITDYLGSPNKYSELSSLHMEKTHYEMGMAAEYVNYIMGIVDKCEEDMF